MRSIFHSLLERRPSTGYIAAAIPTSTGFWAMVDHARNLFGLLSVIVGLVIGLITLQAQLANKRKAKSEQDGLS